MIYLLLSAHLALNNCEISGFFYELVTTKLESGGNSYLLSHNATGNFLLLWIRKWKFKDAISDKNNSEKHT